MTVRVNFGFTALAHFDPLVPAKGRDPVKRSWIPAYAGMSGRAKGHRTHGSPCAQRLYLQLRRQFVELGKKRRRNRNTIPATLSAAGGAALARQADRIEAREKPRAAQIANVPIDFGRESLQRHEPRDVDGNDTMSSIGRAVGGGVEIDHVAAERRAVEHAGNEPDHQ